MARFYSGKGDDGTTGLLGEGRILKSDLRMETIGCIDEASAAIGVARAWAQAPGSGEILRQVQKDLLELMGEIAATEENRQRFTVIDGARVGWLEEQMEIAGKGVEMPRGFITPGDSKAGGCLDIARTVVRRAERRMVELTRRGDAANPELLRYLNRLSSLCFLLELVELQSGE